MNKALANAMLATVLISLPAGAAEDPLSSTMLLPVRLTALGMGIAVGAPISSVRHTVEKVPQMTQAIATELNGAEDPCTLMFSAIPGIPAGIMVGVYEGIQEGTKNALDNCVDKPFSSKSFSLSDE